MRASLEPLNTIEVLILTDGFKGGPQLGPNEMPCFFRRGTVLKAGICPAETQI